MSGLITGDEHKQGLIGTDGKELSTPKPLKTALYLSEKLTPTRNITGYHPWEVVRTANAFVDYIMRNGIPDYISLEHDLHEEHYQDFLEHQAKGIMAISYESFTHKTGYDCARWLVSFCEAHLKSGGDMTNPRLRLHAVGVHALNPAGTQNIIALLSDYMIHRGWEVNVFEAKPEAK
jgi:hypothetical protein